MHVIIDVILTHRKHAEFKCLPAERNIIFFNSIFRGDRRAEEVMDLVQRNVGKMFSAALYHFNKACFSIHSLSLHTHTHSCEASLRWNWSKDLETNSSFSSLGNWISFTFICQSLIWLDLPLQKILSSQNEKNHQLHPIPKSSEWAKRKPQFQNSSHSLHYQHACWPNR